MNAVQAMASFYPAYYLNRYPDVAHAVSNSESEAFRHYANAGINEFRSPNPFFDPSVYRQYPDLSHFSGADLFGHWTSNGINELRRGTESFDLGFYYNNYPDIHQIIGQSADALFQHWIQSGNSEGRKTANGGHILRICWRRNGNATDLVAAASNSASTDPDLFKPFNTTGGQIGFGIGLVIGTVVGLIVGDPIDGAVAGGTIGSLIGHGLDRTITHVSNDITGPAWHDIEQGPLGKILGPLAGGGGSIGIHIGPIHL